MNETDFRCENTEIGAILFSGGTTGIPKQINHSHKCIISMVDRMEWGWPTTPNEKWLVVAPFTHIYGFLTGVTNPLLKSGTVFIPDEFDPKLIVENLTMKRLQYLVEVCQLYTKPYSLLRSLKKIKYLI